MNVNVKAEHVVSELIELSKKRLTEKALHTTLLKKENAIEKEALSLITLYNDMSVAEFGDSQQRITNPFDVEESYNDVAKKEYYELVDEKMRNAGIKPATMKVETFPSCVIENGIDVLNKQIIEVCVKSSIIDVEFADGLMLDIAFYNEFLNNITNICILREKELKQ